MEVKPVAPSFDMFLNYGVLIFQTRKKRSFIFGQIIFIFKRWFVNYIFVFNLELKPEIEGGGGVKKGHLEIMLISEYYYYYFPPSLFCFIAYIIES